MLAYSSIAHAGYILVGVVPRCARSAGGAGERPLLPARLYGLDRRSVRRAGPVRQLRQGGRQLRGPLRDRPPAPCRRARLLALPRRRSRASRRPRGSSRSGSSSATAMDAGSTALAIIAFINSVIGAYYYLRVLVACTCASLRRGPRRGPDALWLRQRGAPRQRDPRSRARPPADPLAPRRDRRGDGPRRLRGPGLALRDWTAMTERHDGMPEARPLESPMKSLGIILVAAAVVGVTGFVSVVACKGNGAKPGESYAAQPPPPRGSGEREPPQG